MQEEYPGSLSEKMQVRTKHHSGERRPGYDRLARRRFEFVPLWGIPVFLVYAPRRVECPACGVWVEAMPWASGKSHLTQAYAWFLDQWCRRTMRSKIEPMKKVARMLRAHCALLLNGFRAKGRLSSGVMENFNTKAKLTSRKSFGFCTYHGAEIALYHVLGVLPEPESTHKFC